MKTVKKIYNSFYSKSTILAFVLLVVLSSIVFRDRGFLSAANVINILMKMSLIIIQSL